MFYDYLVKPFFFRMDPEHAHEWVVGALRQPLLRPLFMAHQAAFSSSSSRLATSLCGIPLAHPVGLAAGFDKNATMYDQLHRLGFAFVEVGTVTAEAQSGNPQPRLFRLPEDEALINRMGFNNDGAAAVSARLAARKACVPLGGNIGKSKVTPLDQALEDYAYSFDLLKPHVDYFVVNVSSPNTPNLRKLQEKGPLLELLAFLDQRNRDPKLPLLLKIAPDLNDHELGDIVEVVEQVGLAGVIATNTTIARTGLRSDAAQVEAIGAGGLSGRPVRARATEVVRFLRRNLPKDVEIVGVGGIFDGADAYEKIRAGARTVQMYTGFIYRGPGAVFKLCRELERLLARDGFARLSDAVGVDA